jgi:hypothetical protein
MLLTPPKGKVDSWKKRDGVELCYKKGFQENRPVYSPWIHRRFPVQMRRKKSGWSTVGVYTTFVSMLMRLMGRGTHHHHHHRTQTNGHPLIAPSTWLKEQVFPVWRAINFPRQEQHLMIDSFEHEILIVVPKFSSIWRMFIPKQSRPVKGKSLQLI